MSPSEQKTYEKARIQVRALRYSLGLPALRELFAPTRIREAQEPRRVVKIHGS